jgi:alkylation response protein AidB-like acyl-CoA dehydrogenase
LTLGHPVTAIIAEGEPGIYVECVHRARIAWAALTTGTMQAVQDHTIPYVNERQAFGEPISNRQAVAFTISDIAIDTESLRLATLRAASRADEGVAFVGETVWAEFRVDLVGSDLTMVGEPDLVSALAVVDMPGIDQRGYRAYPLVDHVADKVAGPGRHEFRRCKQRGGGKK